MREDLRRLKKIVTDNLGQRAQERRNHAYLYARSELIKSAPARVKNMAWWCDQCRQDCDGPGFKEIRWPVGDLWFAFYRGFCPKGHMLVRRITDKMTDPYFFKSRVIQREQAEHADEMLTPNDPRFREVYPEQWADLQGRKGWEESGRKVP